MKKRFVAAGAALLATAFIGQTASAKTLEDILKEKGVITEADYKEVTKVKPLDYKLGKGMTFTSPDEKFQLSIGSQVQVRYTYLNNDENADQSQFSLPRIKLFLNGFAFTKDLTYKVNFNFANTSLEETFLHYRLIDEFQIRAGQDKVQFGRQWITSSGANEFVDASPVTNAFAPGYDTGVSINGKLAGGLAYYTLGGYGGAGQNALRSGPDNAFAARIVVNPLGDVAYSEADVDNTAKPLFSVGSSFYRDALRTGDQAASATGATSGNRVRFMTATTGWYGLGRTAAGAAVPLTESVNFNTAEVDAAFKWRGFFAQAEYFWAQADGDTTSFIQRGQGYYVQAGYFLIPSKLEIAARYSYIDPNRDLSNDNWVETTGAVSWYFNKHNLKIQADVGNVHKQGRIANYSSIPAAARPTAAPTDDLQARIQAQLLF